MQSNNTTSHASTLRALNNNLWMISCTIWTIAACAQNKLPTYKFSHDILNQIAADTVAWKYQVGAPELSFSGYYPEVLKTWDNIRFRKPTDTSEDSLYFAKAKKLNAKDYIIERSKEAQITIINEAHHLPQHRTFTRSLLQDLYNNGYRYLGLEALFDTDTNTRKYATTDSGYYTKEPEFGTLINQAIAIGFKLFKYEAAQGKNGKEREIEQAENIQKFIELNPNGKVLIHCGFAHAFENDYPAWGKAMAGRLKDNLNIDLFTIDQTMFIERSQPSDTPLFMRLNKSTDPIILIDENGEIFNGKGEVKQTDVVMIHPRTQYIDNRPHWLIKDKKKHLVSLNKIETKDPLLILAYRQNEDPNEAIPADIIEVTANQPKTALYLIEGSYTILIKNKDYQTIHSYTTEIK